MKTQKYSNIPIFIPELACPHQCVFCNQEKISSHYSIPQPEEISKTIDQHLSTMDDGRVINIAFFGGNFTGIPISSQEAYLAKAFKYVQSGKVKGIRISTRPDYITPEILYLLKKYGVTTIELGAQSTNDKVLKLSGRGHTYTDIRDSSKLILESGMELGLQMMIGLPGDTFEYSIKTAADIVDLGATSTRIYPTLVIKDTMLGSLYNKGRYTPLTLEEAVSWTKEIVKIFDKNDITILRTGLHPSEDLCEGKALISGPYHISFKELVMTEIWREIIKEKVKPCLPAVRSRKEKVVIIKVNSKQLNYAVGYEGKNKKELAGIGINVKFIGVPNYKKYEINVSNS